jgi:hypothetical protein
MENAKLDAVDCKILEALQRDGRISNVDLKFPPHVSREARDFISKVRSPSFFSLFRVSELISERSNLRE